MAAQGHSKRRANVTMWWSFDTAGTQTGKPLSSRDGAGN